MTDKPDWFKEFEAKYDKNHQEIITRLDSRKANSAFSFLFPEKAEEYEESKRRLKESEDRLREAERGEK